jgi:hypothetical protein
MVKSIFFKHNITTRIDSRFQMLKEMMLEMYDQHLRPLISKINKNLFKGIPYILKLKFVVLSTSLHMVQTFLFVANCSIGQSTMVLVL